MKSLRVLLVCFVAGSLALTEEEWIKFITKSYKEWSTLFSEQDITALTSLHAEDTINLPPGNPIVIGNADYVTVLDNLLQSDKYPAWKNLTFNGLVEFDENYAMCLHISEMMTFDGQYWLGKGVRTFRVEPNGDVKIHLSCWNKDS